MLVLCPPKSCQERGKKGFIPNHLVHGPEAKLSHDGTELVSYVVEEVDHMLRRAGKLLPQLRVLGGDTNRASITKHHVSKKKEKEQVNRTGTGRTGGISAS